MNAVRTAVILSTILLFVSCGPTLVPYARAELEPIAELTGEVHWSVAQAVERAAERFIEEHGVPGLQVALRYRQQRFAGAYGHRDERRGQFARVDDIYRVGSVTKVYTAAVILALVGQGRLGLDVPIGGWVELPNAPTVTVRQLLNHTSGIPDYTERTMSNLGTVLRPRRRWHPEQLIARVRRLELHFPPGSAHRYSNTNYVALGIIAEQVTGRPIAELYRDLVTEPAGAVDTVFLPYDTDTDRDRTNWSAQDADRLVTGYDRDLLPLPPRRVSAAGPNWTSYAFSAGGMASTASDLVRITDHLFDGLLIGPELLGAMTTFLPAPDEDLAEQTGYGLGLRRLQIDGTVLYGHTGTIPGFGAIVLHAPNADYTIAAVGNVSVLQTVELVKTVLAELRETPEWRRR